jgi:uncharacterized protein (TIGR02996 family)
MDMEEQAFLDAITANPADDCHRLVYADWLEERGDPRSEYIRLRLKLPERRGRKRVQARLAELSDDIDDGWRRQVFAVPKLAFKKYRRVKQPVTEPVTKFGGQPVWVSDPAWPISRRGEVMRFVSQVSVPAFFGAPLAGKMVYVFAVHPEFAGWQEFCGRLSPLYPEEGDNAVVIQPDGDPPAPTWVRPLGAKGQRRRKRPLRVEARISGPTLYDDKGQPGEWLVDLEPGADPDFTPNRTDTFPSDDAWQRYWKEVYGEKIGGTPDWGNGLAANINSLVVDPDWRLLLQYDYRGPYFSVWKNEFEWSVWVTRDGKRGLLMGGR